MWEIIALVFCMKIPNGKTCYAFIHTHIKIIHFKGIFILNTKCCNIISQVPIHMPARKYKKFKVIFCLLKYVIIIENIIRHLVKKGTVPTKVKAKKCNGTTLVNGFNSRR